MAELKSMVARPTIDSAMNSIEDRINVLDDALRSLLSRLEKNNLLAPSSPAVAMGDKALIANSDHAGIISRIGEDQSRIQRMINAIEDVQERIALD